MLINGNEQLRFEAVMATNNEIDKDRRFIISLRLSDDMIGTVFVSISHFLKSIWIIERMWKPQRKAIQEIQSRNSGLSAGRFLEYSRIPKPGSSLNSPVYYGLNDFSIGATIIGTSRSCCDIHV